MEKLIASARKMAEEIEIPNVQYILLNYCRYPDYSQLWAPIETIIYWFQMYLHFPTIYPEADNQFCCWTYVISVYCLKHMNTTKYNNSQIQVVWTFYFVEDIILIFIAECLQIVCRHLWQFVWNLSNAFAVILPQQKTSSGFCSCSELL